MNEINLLIQEYLDYEKYNQLKADNTVKNYKLDLILYERYTIKQGKDILNINRKFIEKYKRYLLNDIPLKNGKKGYSVSAAVRHMSAIKNFYKYLVRKGYITTNPTIDIDMPKVPERKPNYLTKKQTIKLVQSVNSENEPYKSRDRLILVLFLTTGLRAEELTNIKISDITENMLRVIGKGNKERIVILNDDTLVALNNYLKVRPNVKTDYLFISERNKQMSKRTIQYTVDKYLKKTGLEGYSTHSLRHSAATLMYRGGMDIKAIQEVLGHNNISTTEIYTHIDIGQLEKVANVTQGLYSKEINE